jgi:hypothetical protein
MNMLSLLASWRILHIVRYMNSFFCTVSPGFAKQILSILLILCYNGSLVTWTVVSLTSTKFKPCIFSATSQNQSQNYVTNDGQSASLSWCQAPIWGLRPDLYYCQTLRVCWCAALSLTRERVCRLQSLLVLASAVILGSESRETRDHILLSQIRDSPNLEGQVPVFISPRNRVAHFTPRYWVPFSSPPTTRSATVVVLEPAPRGGFLSQLTGPAYNISARAT